MRHEPSNGTVLRRLHARLARVNRIIAKGHALIGRRSSDFGDRRETADAKATGRVAKLFAIALLAIFSAGDVLAQTPDCVSYFTFSNVPGSVGTLPAPGTTPTIDNRQTACINWTMVYESSGFTVVSLVFQSADGATVPGTMVTFTGSILSGTNPATSTVNSTTTFNGYVGWFRVNLATATGVGTVRGALYGYRNGYPPPVSGSPCPGTILNPCVVVGSTPTGSTPTAAPVEVAGVEADGFGTGIHPIATDALGAVYQPDNQNTLTDGVANSAVVQPKGIDGTFTYVTFPFVFNGTTWDRQFSCTNVAIVDDSTSGVIQQIALVGGKTIHICKLSLTSAAAVTVQLVQGVGANCGVPVNLSGLYQGITAIAEDFQADQAPLVTFTGDAVCLSLSGAIRTTGQIVYAQF